MSSPVDLIKERLSIADVVGSYIKLEKAGSNLKAKCPFHNEKTPSFFVSPARSSYYCFGCGAKGDILSFVQEFEGVDFMGALKILASKAGVEIVKENPKIRSERERLFMLMETAVSFYQTELSKNDKVKEYLSDRGIKPETIKNFRIGFAPDEWRKCYDHCGQVGFSEAEQEKAGLIKKAERKSYDRFRGRVMFPIFDSSGRPVAFSGRIFGKETAEAPKYLNSPETPLFSKSSILFGFDRAKSDIRRMDYSILVEGQVDLVMCHQAGFKNAVATSGTALTENQLGLLNRLSRRILMVYDADKAGVVASLRSASLALSMGMDVKVAKLPKGFDPAELILKDVAKWKECLKSSKHVIDFYLDNIMEEKLDSRKLAMAIKDKVLPLVATLEGNSEKSHFIHEIAERTTIKEQAIHDDLKRVATKDKDLSVGSVIVSSLLSRKNQVERLLLGLILWQEKVDEPKLDIVKLKDDYSKILGQNKFKEIFDESKRISDELIFQAESYYSDRDELELELVELLTNLEEDVIKEELGVAVRDLSFAEKGRDIERSKELLALCHRLSSRLAEIKKKRSV